jgi:hypothetical protein
MRPAELVLLGHQHETRCVARTGCLSLKLMRDPVPCVRYTLCTNEGGISDKRQSTLKEGPLFRREMRHAHRSYKRNDRIGCAARVGIRVRSAMANREAVNTQIVMVGLRHRTCSAGTSV